MKRRNTLLMLIFVLALVLILLVVASLDKPGSHDSDPSGSSQDSQVQTDPSGSEETSDPTQTDATQPSQTDSTEPSETDPTGPSEPSVTPGTDTGLYTRQELESLSTESYGYGPGRTSGGKRAPYAESDQLKYGQYGANFIAPDNGNIYLTFDCGYEYTATDENGSKYRVTEKILNVLKEKNVKAVFFVTMDYVTSEPDLVQRMIDEGHAVGNHSNNHPVMPDCTIDKMIYEVTSLHEYVLEHFGYEMHLFRPPTGQFSIQSLAVVQNLGYKNVHWSFAYADYYTDNQMDVSEALALVTNSHHSGAIYLLHAVSTTNAALLGDAIDFFIAEGYNIALFD